MAVEYCVVTLYLPFLDPCLLQFTIKEQAGTGADGTVDNLNFRFCQVFNPGYIAGIPRLQQEPLFAAASLFTVLTGGNAATSGYVPYLADKDRWTTIAAGAVSLSKADESATHYLGAYAGSVRLDNKAIGSTYRYMTVGTSSEAGWASAMAAMLVHEGVTGAYQSGGPLPALGLPAGVSLRSDGALRWL